MKIFYLLFFFGITLPSSAQIPSYVPTVDLVAWWPLDNNASDLSGNNHNGTNLGATGTTDRFGINNGAFLFDGNDQIEIPDHQDLRIGKGAMKQFSVSAWYLRTANPTGPENIIAKGQSPNQSAMIDYRIIEISNNASPVFGMNAHITQMGVNCGNQNVGHPQLNEWHHLVFTMRALSNETGIKKIYLDGSLIDSCSYDQKTESSSNNLFIGATGFSSIDAFWNGKIDDIGIWNRALTTKEVKGLYSSTITGIEEQVTVEVSIYPNPIQDVLHFDLKNLQNGSIEIRNTLGQKVFSSDYFTSTFSINLKKHLESGTYYVFIQDSKQYLVSTKKLVKVR